jgi:leader peptidase (prepilin peptidase) / N-methyltransferase
VILGDLPLWFARALALAFGLVWGSFLNVVIYRVPRDLSVVRPGSTCPGCQKPIAWYDNVPVVSWVLLRGRARCCGIAISPRYPLVELIGGALSLAIVEVILRALPASEPLGRAAAIYGADFALCMGLVAAAFIDAEYMYLPNPITYGGTVLGIGTASLHGMHYLDALIGAGVGYAVLLVVDFVYKRIRGRAGTGLGDAKLLMLAGAWFGWQGVYFTLLAGSIQGTLYAIGVYFVRGKIEEPEAVRQERAELERAAREGDEEAKEILEEDPLGKPPEEGFARAPIPFGPFLILAILEYLFLRDWILAVFRRFISPIGFDSQG